MPHDPDIDDPSLIVDCIHDTIVPDPNPPKVPFSVELAAAMWAGFLGQGFYLQQDSIDKTLLEGFQLISSRAGDSSTP